MLELADDEKLKKQLKEDAQLSATAIEELKGMLNEDKYYKGGKTLCERKKQKLAFHKMILPLLLIAVISNICG